MENTPRNSYRNAPKQDSLARRTYNSAKNLAYGALIAGAAYLAPSFSPTHSSKAIGQELVTNLEEFTEGIINMPYVGQDPTKWGIVSVEQPIFGPIGRGASTNEVLQVKDYDGDWGDIEKSWGHNRFSFLDLRDIANENVSLEVDMERSTWYTSADEIGIILAGDPTMGENGTYWKFSINTKNRPQYTLQMDSPGFSNNIWFNTSLVSPGETKIKLRMEYNSANSESYSFFINSQEIPSDQKTKINRFLPKLTGYPALTIYDAKTDSGCSTTTNFDNFKIEYDTTAGGAGGNLERKVQKGFGRLMNPARTLGLEKNPVIIPNTFRRGDSNMDGSHDISDAINTLSYLFLGGTTLRCPDAADTNDDGQVDLSDAVMSLNAIFLDSTIKIPPPNIIEQDGKLVMDAAQGIDTTSDKLGPCIGNDYVIEQ
jgi:hypothetical protein